MKVGELRRKIEEMRRTLRDESDLLDLNQRTGITRFSRDGYEHLKRMTSSCDLALNVMVAGVAQRDEDFDLKDVSEEKLDSVVAGFADARRLLIKSLTGADPAEA